MKKNAFPQTIADIIEKEFLAEYPDLDRDVQLFRSSTSLTWPDWCYLPMTASYAIVIRDADEIFAKLSMANALMNNFHYLSAIIPWRVGKPVYRFDEDFEEELMNSGSEKEKFPVELLFRMPYPGLFIEKPYGMKDVCDGMYVFLEYDKRYPNAVELRMHYVFKDETIGVAFFQYDVHNADATLFSAKLQTEARNTLLEIGGLPRVTLTPANIDAMMSNCRQHLNYLLYLCSEEPDITRTAPIPRVKKNGVAAYSDKIAVGNQAGVILREARRASHASEETEPRPEGSHGRKIPHMRRAHWHLYWTEEGRKTPRLKWVQPVFVGGRNVSKPTTIIREKSSRSIEDSPKK